VSQTITTDRLQQSAFGRVLTELLEERGYIVSPAKVRLLAERSGLEGSRVVGRMANAQARHVGNMTGLADALETRADGLLVQVRSYPTTTFTRPRFAGTSAFLLCYHRIPRAGGSPVAMLQLPGPYYRRWRRHILRGCRPACSGLFRCVFLVTHFVTFSRR
jgi:hypothetical protein